jgi:hypothetical protein
MLAKLPSLCKSAGVLCGPGVGRVAADVAAACFSRIRHQLLRAAEHCCTWDALCLLLCCAAGMVALCGFTKALAQHCCRWVSGKGLAAAALAQPGSIAITSRLKQATVHFECGQVCWALGGRLERACGRRQAEDETHKQSASSRLQL